MKAILRHRYPNAGKDNRVQRKKWVTEKLKKLEFCTGYEARLSNKLKGLEDMSNIGTEWKGIKRVMTEVTEELIYERKVRRFTFKIAHV